MAKELILSNVLKGRKQLQSFVDVSVVIHDDSGKNPEVIWSIDDEKKTAYVSKYFGKKLICTCRSDLSMLDILSTYAEQECIENLFRVSKNTDHFSIRPQFHWTDQKIRVHVMICLMGIALVEVLRRKTAEAGLVYSKEALIDKLVTIRDGWVIRDMKQAERVLEDMDAYDNHKWVRFMCHSYTFGNGETFTGEAELIEILEYIQTLGIPVVTYGYMFDRFKSSALEERIKAAEALITASTAS